MGSSRSLCHRRGPAKRIRRDFIRDPALLEFLGLPNAGLIQENELEQALIDQLQGFLLAFDLKPGVLTHQDVGQMDMYVRMYDELKRGPEDSPTVGLILCAQKDESVVRYSVLQGNEQLFASTYRLVLPSEEELRTELDREWAVLEERLLKQRAPISTGGLFINGVKTMVIG